MRELPIKGAAIPANLREANRKKIFELLRMEGILSRAEIARLTGISVPTVSAAIRFFIEKGLAEEIGESEGQGRLGRKPIMVRFNPDAAYALGIDLGGHSIDVGVVNLAGELKGQISRPCAGGVIAAKDLDFIPELIEDLLRRLGLSRQRILGVGVGMPGVTDPNAGTVRLAPQLGLDSLEAQVPYLRESLHLRTGLPICLENDVNAAALGEQRARGKDCPLHFAFVSVGVGIGAGLIFDGRLYRGSHNASGEIGYMIVNGLRTSAPDGFGGLERIASCAATVERAKALGWIAKKTAKSADCLVEEVRQLGEEAEMGLEPARSVLLETAEHLALALVNMVSVYDPALVVLGGVILEAGPWFLARLQEKFERLSPIPIPIEPSRNGSRAGLVGAAEVASVANLDDFLSD